MYVNISLLPCPPDFKLTKTAPCMCECSVLLQKLLGVECNIQDQTVEHSGSVWVGGNDSVVVSEYCPYNYCKKEKVNVTLSDPDSQCDYNHAGTLCGQCQQGLSLALGSAKCLPCSNKYLALIIPFLFAGLALVLFIKALDLTISQGTRSSLLKANEYIFLPQNLSRINIFISWLNLDLGIETCFVNGLTPYSITWLQFVFPLYIWSIAGLARYNSGVARVMGNNSVPVLATLFLLSYSKLFRNIITALSYTMVYTSHGSKAVWSADGDLDYLGPKHAPLFAVAVAVLLFLWLPCTLFFMFGQCLYKLNCQPISQTMTKLKPFLDAHYNQEPPSILVWSVTVGQSNNSSSISTYPKQQCQCYSPLCICLNITCGILWTNGVLQPCCINVQYSFLYEPNNPRSGYIIHNNNWVKSDCSIQYTHGTCIHSISWVSHI